MIHWILLYFYVREAFDPDNCAAFYKLSGDNQSFIIKEKQGDGCAYLSQIIKCGVHKWKFKLVKMNRSGWNMTIGVWRCNYPLNKRTTMWDDETSKGREYGWMVNYTWLTFGDNHGELTYKGMTPCSTGDVIEMKLDLNQWKLSYSKNGDEFLIAHDNIEKTSYVAVVCGCRDGECVELISYQWKY